MSSKIKTQVIKIGNSQGIRIPKPLLEQSGIQKDVEIEVQSDRLIIRAVSQPRQGWDEAFAKMAERGDDVLLNDVDTTDWDHSEWEW
jgi:antitoxin MazE